MSELVLIFKTPFPLTLGCLLWMTHNVKLKYLNHWKNTRNMQEIKTFGGNMQPIFSENRNIANKVTLVDDNELITSGDNQVSEELNTFFQNTIKTLNITEGSYLS